MVPHDGGALDPLFQNPAPAYLGQATGLYHVSGISSYACFFQNRQPESYGLHGYRDFSALLHHWLCLALVYQAYGHGAGDGVTPRGTGWDAWAASQSACLDSTCVLMAHRSDCLDGGQWFAGANGDPSQSLAFGAAVAGNLCLNGRLADAEVVDCHAASMLPGSQLHLSGFLGGVGLAGAPCRALIVAHEISAAPLEANRFCPGRGHPALLGDFPRD